MRRGGKRVKSGDGAEVRALGAALFIHQILGVTEAAAALRFMPQGGIGLFRGPGAGAGEVADLLFAYGIAAADDHGDRFTR
jgi:hypothetical protein